MPVGVEPPTGQQTMSMREVDQFLTEARMAPNTKSPRILGINQIPIMRARSNGYPIWLYHETLEARQAFKEEEEQALVVLGYRREYIAKAYPKTLFRRNMDARFEPRFDKATGIQENHSFVEERCARDAKQEKELRLMKPKNGQSDWVEKLADLPELADGPTENPMVTIARLQGELAGLLQGKPGKAA